MNSTIHNLFDKIEQLTNNSISIKTSIIPLSDTTFKIYMKNITTNIYTECDVDISVPFEAQLLAHLHKLEDIL